MSVDRERAWRIVRRITRNVVACLYPSTSTATLDQPTRLHSAQKANWEAIIQTPPANVCWAYASLREGRSCGILAAEHGLRYRIGAHWGERPRGLSTAKHCHSTGRCKCSKSFLVQRLSVKSPTLQEADRRHDQGSTAVGSARALQQAYVWRHSRRGQHISKRMRALRQCQRMACTLARHENGGHCEMLSGDQPSLDVLLGNAPVAHRNGWRWKAAAAA